MCSVRFKQHRSFMTLAEHPGCVVMKLFKWCLRLQKLTDILKLT